MYFLKIRMKKELRLLFISTILVLSFLFSLSFTSSLENGQCDLNSRQIVARRRQATPYSTAQRFPAVAL